MSWPKTLGHCRRRATAGLSLSRRKGQWSVPRARCLTPDQSRCFVQAGQISLTSKGRAIGCIALLHITPRPASCVARIQFGSVIEPTSIAAMLARLCMSPTCLWVTDGTCLGHRYDRLRDPTMGCVMMRTLLDVRWIQRSALTHGLVLLCIDAYCFIFGDLPGDVLAAPE